MIKTNRIRAAKTGTIKSFTGSLTRLPQGYVVCDGSIVDNTIYPNLYASLGTSYGVMGTLPDLRGEFIRGLDHSRGLDTGRTFGSNQAQDIRSHNHTYIQYNQPPHLGGSPGIANVSAQTVNSAASGGTETRPRNVALHYIIKT